MSSTKVIIETLCDGYHRIHRHYFILPKDFNEVPITNTIKKIHEDLNNDIDGKKYPLVYGSDFEGLFILLGSTDDCKSFNETHDSELNVSFRNSVGIDLEPDDNGSCANTEYDGGVCGTYYNRNNIKIMMKNLFHELNSFKGEPNYPINQLEYINCDPFGSEYAWDKNKPIMIDVYYGRFFRH